MGSLGSFLDRQTEAREDGGLPRRLPRPYLTRHELEKTVDVFPVPGEQGHAVAASLCLLL